MISIKKLSQRRQAAKTKILRFGVLVFFNLASLKGNFETMLKLLLRLSLSLFLLLSFFPDPYIHDIKLEQNKKEYENVIKIYLLSYEERGIAIGRNGDYIKAINDIFKSYVEFEEFATFRKYKIPIRVSVEVTDLELSREINDKDYTFI